jgi:hypothetical protein
VTDPRSDLFWHHICCSGWYINLFWQLLFSFVLTLYSFCMHVLKSLGFRRQGVTLLLKRHVRAPGRQGPRLWCRRRRAHPPAVPPVGLLVWLVADGWCWFVLREKYYWLVAGGWFLIWGKSTASWWLISQSNRARAAQKATRGDGYFSCCLRCGVLHFNKELGITPSIPINQVVLDKISVKYWECKSW